MSLKSKRRENLSKRSAELDALAFRAFEVRAQSIDIEKRTVVAVILTDSPVMMPDTQRGEMIPEVILTSGVEFPATRQIPLLDSHQRRATEDQLGSIRELSAGPSQIDGVLHFSAAAEKQWIKVREGHITDVSAGYKILKKVFVPRGETRTIDGRIFTGPVSVITKSRLYEGSILPIGADQQAKLRSLDPTALLSDGNFKMDPKLKALLVTRGMPADLDDAAAQKWQIDNQARWLAPEAPAPVVAATPAPTVGLTAEQVAKVSFDTFTRLRAEEVATERARNEEIGALCVLADLPDLAAEARALPDMGAVRKFLADKKAERAVEFGVSAIPNIRITGEGRQRFYYDVGTALTLRCMRSAGDPELNKDQKASESTIAKIFPVEQRAKGAEQWANVGIFDLARECLRIEGIDTRGWTREQIAIGAMFGAAAVPGLNLRAAGPAYNTSGNFTNLTLDAINKSMMVGYTEAPSTWEGPMRRGESAADFKQIHRVRLGAIPNLPAWNDDSNPEKASFADAQEQYAVEARSIEIGFSYRLLVNDDMSVLSRVPGQMGAAAKRTVNAVAWTPITSNPTMGADGVALFSAASGKRKRSNFTSPGAVPSVAQLGTNTNLMMQMRGENTPEGTESADVLALMPRYVVGPSALRTTILQLVLSAYDPAANAFQRYNTATELIPVIEPLLDANSTTAWYLFASTSQIDTIEVTFLQGQETPSVRQFMDERSLTQFYTVLQTFAAAPLNHRGIVKDNGT